MSISPPFVQIGEGINISWQENMWIICKHFFEAAHFGYAFLIACANEWRGQFLCKKILKKFLSNLQKWVCISSPFVQISRGIKFFLKNTPQKWLCQFKQVRGILNPFNRTLTTEYPLPSGDTTPRPFKRANTSAECGQELTDTRKNGWKILMKIKGEI